MGPPGLLGPDTAMAVYARAVLPPPPVYSPTAWTPIDFNVREWDTHGTLMPGANWLWSAPFRGTYHLYSALCLEPLAGSPTWAMRVMKQGMEEVYQEFAGYTGQIHWLGLLNPGETLQVQIKATGPIPVVVRGGPPRSSIVIAGCGAVL